MVTTIHTNANDIDKEFIKVIGKLFHNKRIKVTIEDEIDETEYLLSEKANAAFLTKSMKEVSKGEVVRIPASKFK